MKIMATAVLNDGTKENIELQVLERMEYYDVVFKHGAFGVLPINRIERVEVVADGVTYICTPHLPLLKIAKQQGTPMTMRYGVKYEVSFADFNTLYAEAYISEDTGQDLIQLLKIEGDVYRPICTMTRRDFAMFFQVDVLRSEVFQLAGNYDSFSLNRGELTYD